MVNWWPLKIKPYPVQVEALNRSAGRDCYGWWLEQGLGKTAVQYADFLRRHMDNTVDVLLMVTPYYLLTEWPLEANKQGMKIPVYTWPNNLPTAKSEYPYVFVINIEAARDGRGKEYVAELIQKHRCMFGIDESTLIKRVPNNNGKKKGLNTKAMLELANIKPETLRRELSGVPNPHDVMDFWPQLRFLKQLNGVNPYAFRNRFAVMGGYMSKTVKGVKNEGELRAILDKCSFRALKADWAKSLPPKLYKQRHFEMEGKQLKAYREMNAEFVTFVNEADPESAVFADQMIHAMLKLQQISRGFIIANDKTTHELVDRKKNPAINVLLEDLDTIQGKVLIFTSYRHSTAMVYEALKDAGIGTRMLMGGMEPEAIGKEKDEFNNDPSVKAFVLQTAVGHRGHTLLGQPGPSTRCSDTIFFENTYNYEHRAQGEDRNHRWGQDADTVTYTDYVCSNTDLRVIKALQLRRDLVHAILDGVRDGAMR